MWPCGRRGNDEKASNTTETTKGGESGRFPAGDIKALIAPMRLFSGALSCPNALFGAGWSTHPVSPVCPEDSDRPAETAFAQRGTKAVPASRYLVLHH